MLALYGFIIRLVEQHILVSMNRTNWSLFLLGQSP